MLEKHTVKNGDTILIAQMSDEHLTNFIKMICRQIIERRKMAQTPEIVDDYQRRLYDTKKIDAKEAAAENRLAFKLLYPYLAEAFVREGMDDARKIVIEALGRKTSIQDALAIALPSSLDELLGRSDQDVSREFERVIRKEVTDLMSDLDDFR